MHQWIIEQYQHFFKLPAQILRHYVGRLYYRYGPLTASLIFGHLAEVEVSSPMEQFVFHHVGIAVRNLLVAIPVYRTLFGYGLTSGPFDDPIQNVSVCFLSRGNGDTAIELVAPLGPKSPIERTLKNGGGPYHICYEVPNIESAIAYLTEQGSFLVSGPVPAVAFEMREIAWLMTEADLLVELVQAY